MLSMDSNDFYKKTEQHVTGLFQDNKNPELLFHNLDHQIDVFDRTKEIAGHNYLCDTDMLIV